MMKSPYELTDRERSCKGRGMCGVCCASRLLQGGIRACMRYNKKCREVAWNCPGPSLPTVVNSMEEKDGKINPKRPYTVLSPDNLDFSMVFLAENAVDAMEKMLYTLSLEKKSSGIIKKSKHGAVMETENAAYFCKEHILTHNTGEDKNND